MSIFYKPNIKQPNEDKEFQALFQKTLNDLAANPIVIGRMINMLQTTIRESYQESMKRRAELFAIKADPSTRLETILEELDENKGWLDQYTLMYQFADLLKTQYIRKDAESVVAALRRDRHGK